MPSTGFWLPRGLYNAVHRLLALELHGWT